MKDKAIVFVVFDRVDYLSNTLNAWAKVRNLDTYDIYFMVEPSEKIQEIIKLIKEFEAKVSLPISISINGNLLGNAKNIWDSFESLFKKYDFVILAEDDIIPSKDIADYFNFLENKYRNVEEIAVISASNRNGSSKPNEVVRTSGFPGLIWGTWKKYWDSFFKDTWDFDYSTGTVEHPQSGWDWNLTLRVMPKNNLWSIYPESSRSQHIGVEGLHCNKEIFEYTVSPSFRKNYEWEELVEV